MAKETTPKSGPRAAYDPVTYRTVTKGGYTTNIFSSNIPHRAPVLCYIAGIECPIISAQVDYGVWQIPQATIALFPDPGMQRLGAEDRLPVALFYLDEYIDPDYPKWCLIFDGDICGWSYTNTPLGRSLQIQCLSDISIYTQLQFYYMTTLSEVAQGNLDARQKGEQVTMARAVFPYSLFTQGLVTKVTTKADGSSSNANDPTEIIKRPFDLVYNVVRALAFDQVPKDQQSTPAVNFFKRWVRRQQFHNRWVALPFLDEPTEKDGVFPVLKAAQSFQAVDALAKFTSQQGGGAQIFTWLKMVLDTVLMELAMLPTPAVVRTYNNGVIVGQPVLRTGEELGVQQSTAKVEKTTATATMPADLGAETSKASTANVPVAPKTPTRLTQYFVKPQCYFGLPPVSNVIFPSMTPSITYSENYINQPTRLYFQDDTLMKLVPAAQKSPDVSKYALTVLARAFPPAADWRFQEHLKEPKGTGKNILLWPEEFFKGPVTDSYPAPRWLMFLMQNMPKLKDKATGAEIGKARDEVKAALEGSADRKAAVSDPNVFSLYAQYTYFQRRYAQRNGSVSCAFNPYLLPGFPTMIFDDNTSRMHIMGYMLNASQSFSAQGVSSSFNYSYARTIYELLAEVAQEMDNPADSTRKGLATAMAPPEPIEEIRNIMQHEYKADQFYQALFYQRLEQPKKTAVFRYRELLSTQDDTGAAVPLEIEGFNEEGLSAAKYDVQKAREKLEKLKTQGLFTSLLPDEDTALRQSLKGAGVQLDDEPITSAQVDSLISKVSAAEQDLQNPKVKHNLNKVTSIIPHPSAEPLFDSYDAAMQYSSRPICTLEDYISFINGVREGAMDDVAYRTAEGAVPSARYYTKIKHYIPAEANFKPTDKQQGLEKGVEQGEAINADPKFPQLRADWEKTLMAYRQNIYTVYKAQR